MCAPIWTLWAGRKSNGPIVEGPRGGNVNTRVVKLQPLKAPRTNGDDREVSKDERGGDLLVPSMMGSG